MPQSRIKYIRRITYDKTDGDKIFRQPVYRIFLLLSKESCRKKNE